MKILIWLPYIPYPLDSGGNKAIYSMIDHFRKKHDISIGLNIRSNGLKAKPKARKLALVNQLKALWPEVTFYLYEGQPEYDENLYPQSFLCKVLDYLQHSLARKYKRAYGKWSLKHKDGDSSRAKSLLTRELRQYNPGFLRFVEDVSARGFDVIQVEMYEFLFLGYLLPDNVRRVFIHHELRFIRLQNEMALFREKSGNDLLAFEQAKAAEVAALQVYDYIVTLTKTDRSILSRYLNQEQIIISPAVIMPEGGERSFRPCRDFVFVGSGEHEPNVDGIRWFAQEVLPELRKKGISIRLYIVGRWNERLCQQYRDGSPEIVFTGFVDDLSQFLNGKISIVPIRMGSGMRIKIIEAINAMSPFISTVKGVEGLDFRHEKECYITDDAAEFANYMALLYEDAGLQQRLAQNAFQRLETYYNAEYLYTVRNQVYI